MRLGRTGRFIRALGCFVLLRHVWDAAGAYMSTSYVSPHCYPGRQQGSSHRHSVQQITYIEVIAPSSRWVVLFLIQHRVGTANASIASHPIPGSNHDREFRRGWDQCLVRSKAHARSNRSIALHYITESCRTLHRTCESPSLLYILYLYTIINSISVLDYFEL